MALSLKDRVKQAISVGGTGNLTLSSAAASYQALSVAEDGLSFPYVIEDGSAWETGIGTYTHSGTSFARTTRSDSSTGASLNVSTSAMFFVDFIASAGNSIIADIATNVATISRNRIAVGDIERIAVIGTSISNKWLDAGVATASRSIGGDSYLWWMQVALRGRIRSLLVKGVSGNTTTQMVARYAADIAANYSQFDTLLIEPGPNDYSAGLSYATIVSNITTMVSAARLSGKTVILLTPTPTEYATPAQNAVLQDIRQWMLTNPAFRPNAGVRLVDVTTPMCDPLTGLPLSELFVPTTIESVRVHPSISGAQVMGRTIAESIPMPIGSQRAWASPGQRDYNELLPNSKLIGNNASGSRNFYAGAGVTVTGGPDSSAISIGRGTFASVTIAPAGTATGTDLALVGNVGTRITIGAAGSDRSLVILRIGSSDTTVGGTQYGRWDNNLANQTYIFGDHARLAASPDGILTCIVGGATGTASATAPAAYGMTLVVGAATFIWQRLPAAADLIVPEIEYEIEAQNGGFCIIPYVNLYRAIGGGSGEMWGSETIGFVDEGATITQGLPGVWMPRRGVMQGLPIALVNPGVSLRHACVDLRLLFALNATATIRFDRVSLRRIG